MESIQIDLEASQDNTHIYNNLKSSSASNITLTFDTDDSGIKNLSEKGVYTPNIDGNIVYEDERIHGSLKSHEEMGFLTESFLTEPKLALFQEVLKFPRNKAKYGPLSIDLKYSSLDLQFSIKVEKLIIQDSIFGRFIREIEKILNKFIELEHVGLENKIFFEEDWEIQDYEKLILSLNFKGIPFKREMLLWKAINTMMYKRIKYLIIYSSEENLRRFKELKKKFFIKLEM